MTTTRFRYDSDDTTPVQIDPSFGARPAIVEPGHVVEIGVGLSEDDAAAAVKAVAADPRFRKAGKSEPVTTDYVGWSGDELRDELDGRGVERTGARTNADLEALLVENDRVNPQPLGNLGSTLAPLDELREDAVPLDATATEPGGTEPADDDTTPEA